MKRVCLLFFVVTFILITFTTFAEQPELVKEYRSDHFIVPLPKEMYHFVSDDYHNYYGRPDKYVDEGRVMIYEQEFDGTDNNVFDAIYANTVEDTEKVAFFDREIFSVNGTPGIFYSEKVLSNDLLACEIYLYNNGHLLDIVYMDASRNLEQTRDKLIEIANTVTFISPFDTLSSPILFRNIPWGTSYDSVEKMFAGTRVTKFTGFGMRTYTCADYVEGDFAGKSYPSNNINLQAYIYGTSVAGYEANINMSFVYTPVNGELSYSTSETGLFAARYEIEPADVVLAEKDLRGKLESVYGKGKTSTIRESSKCTLTQTTWFVGKEMELLLKAYNYNGDATEKDQITINYVWLRGDKLLDLAFEVEQKANKMSESTVYGNSNTEGL